MKKNYIQPEITASLRYEMEKPLCQSGERKFSFGNNDVDNQYSNSDWFNQGYGTPTETIENDNGVLNSQTKGRGSDWGNIW